MELPWKGVRMFVTHGKPVIKLAGRLGWLPGARYTNLRDIRDSKFRGIGFLDINWKAYDFERHLAAAARTLPLLTVARDVTSRRQLDETLRQAESLARYSKFVVVVPKDPSLAKHFREIPARYLLGFSVPTKYGATRIAPKFFDRPVHLLGGRAGCTAASRGPDAGCFIGLQSIHSRRGFWRLLRR
jgi:hypothetical protein